ncbi:hypothetical protein GWK26_11870 [haloarchaeon 3A1-DGR]|nr:hypothetical protein GWK26_11870 [haloarchaeon 3A1-DGR]
MPPSREGGRFDPVLAGDFVEDSEILVGKLIGTLLSAFWLAVVSGWLTFAETIATIHIRVILSFRDAYVTLFETLGQEAEATFLESWATAFEASVEVSPLFAPAIFTVELALVAAIVLVFRRRVVT